MNIGKKLLIKLDSTQRDKIIRWFGSQRYIYNQKVKQDRELLLSDKNHKINQQYSQFKTDDNLWLNNVPSEVLRNGSYKYFQSYQRCFNGLAKKPNFQSKFRKSAVMLTNELFKFNNENNLIIGKDSTKDKKSDKYIGLIQLPEKTKILIAGLKTLNTLPNIISISLKANKFYLSFSYEDSSIIQSDKELLDYIKQHSVEELKDITIGIDRGISINLAMSNGVDLKYTETIKHNLIAINKDIAKLQRKAARQVKYSQNYNKTKIKIQTKHFKKACIKNNFNHHASKSIVNGGQIIEENNTIKYLYNLLTNENVNNNSVTNKKPKLLVFEKLQLKNMTKSAKGTIEKPGKNVKQKAGLNRSLLNVNLGQIKTYVIYKGRKQGVLTVEVKPQYSSQECHKCGFTHKENRVSQTIFSCLSCGLKCNADYNASMVIKHRGINLVLSPDFLIKEKKKISFRKKKKLLPKVTNEDSNLTNKINLGTEDSKKSCGVVVRQIS